MSRYVLGISALYHDSAVTLLKDGVIVAAASEERFSRIKHDASIPVRAARWALSVAGIQAHDLEAVVYYEKPLRKLERMMVSQVLEFPRSFQAFRRSTFSWLSDKLWIRANLVQSLGIRSEQLLFCDHHLSHAASAFYTSPWPEAAVLTVDGVGEWASTSLYRGSDKGIELLSELHFPHSIGLVYSAFTAWMGFQVNDGEYKLMGLAPYGEPRFVDEVRKVLRLHDDGSFEVDTRYVSYHYSATDSITRAFEDLFGPARHPDEPLDPRTPAGKRRADVAASIQRVTEEALIGLAKALHARVGGSRLCLAGGVGLNSVANRHLLEQGPFSELWVQPAAGDAGGSMGAALWAWTEVLGGARVDPGLKPGLGQGYADGDIARFLHELKAKFEELPPDTLCERAAEDLAAGRAVGWFQGRFEWGPRALGHRSILADPRGGETQERVNAKIKFRESFRPFAPSVLDGAEDRFFQLPRGGEGPLEWMLLVAPVRDSAKELLPATTHVDGSARVQVVKAEANPLYHQLLERFGEMTGCPILLNTSFNLKGEPIVSSPGQALATFLRSGLDTLYLGNCRLENGQWAGRSGGEPGPDQDLGG